jgi:hypothetical protein
LKAAGGWVAPHHHCRFIELEISMAPKDNDSDDGYDQKNDRRAGKNGILWSRLLAKCQSIRAAYRYRCLFNRERLH